MEAIIYIKVTLIKEFNLKFGLFFKKKKNVINKNCQSIRNGDTLLWVVPLFVLLVDK